MDPTLHSPVSGPVHPPGGSRLGLGDGCRTGWGPGQQRGPRLSLLRVGIDHLKIGLTQLAGAFYGSTAMIGVPGSTDGLGPILFNYVTPIKKWARRVRLSGTSPCLNSVFWHGSKPPRLHHESDKRSASLALDMEGEGSYNERFPPKREGLCRVSGAGQRGLWVLLFISAPWPGGRRSSRSRRKMVE